METSTVRFTAPKSDTIRHGDDVFDYYARPGGIYACTLTIRWANGDTEETDWIEQRDVLA